MIGHHQKHLEAGKSLMEEIGDGSSVEKDRVKHTSDIPSATSLARVSKTVGSGLQANTTLVVTGDRVNTLNKEVLVK